MEKKERLKVSLPPDAQNALERVAAQRRVAASALVRDLVLEFLFAETGKRYEPCQWGGHRAGAGRKPVRSDRVRAAAKKTSRTAGA